MITASSGRPMSPPSSFAFSIIMTRSSWSGRSLAVMVPESECRMPTLMAPESRSVK
jgi:hypothetical protein